MPAPFAFAHDIAKAIASGDVTARAVAEAALARIAAVGGPINAFTDVTTARAMEAAETVDAARDRGEPLGPLAGVPYAVKNLYDVQGLSTRAGSKINRERKPADRDATLVTRMDAAGGVLVGALNMGEYAYDFTGENAHDGPSRNPHDVTRMSGGSSSGSGAATAAGLAPLSLGSDTNGSIRVPASLCGIFGLKPTYGRLGRGGSFPFCDSLDHLGPFARCVTDLALTYDALQGPDERDHACAARSVEPAAAGLAAPPPRIAVLGGHFAESTLPEAREAVARVADALGTTRTVTVDGAEAGRAAAFVITNAESANLHLERLRTRLDDLDPDTRDRFLAGALLPASWYVQAQRVRRWWARQLALAIADVDVLIAPATPCTAPLIGQKTMSLDGKEVLVRPNLGLFTQPISCVGLPVVAAPMMASNGLPIAVQLIAKPWREVDALRAAAALERAGVAAAPRPSGLDG